MKIPLDNTNGLVLYAIGLWLGVNIGDESVEYRDLLTDWSEAVKRTIKEHNPKGYEEYLRKLEAATR